MPVVFSEFATADRPLEHPDTDTLGRAAFAQRIAHELRSSTRRDPLLIALNGESGAGRTTLKNFIRHSLLSNATPSERGPTVIEFTACECHDEAALLRQFFEHVSRELARESASAQLQALSTAWRAWTTAVLPRADGEQTTMSAHEARRAVLQCFEALTAPVIVFIDDIDRLPPTQMRALFTQLGRMDFPNLVSFLLLQRTVILEALAGATGSANDAFRKIVHVELELPEVPDSLLRRQLETGLEQRLSTVTFPARPRERWTDLIGSAVWPLFSTPRDIQRFLAAFNFQFDGFFNAEERVLEVNPGDLVLLEALRMFAPRVYSDLRDTFRRRETRIVRLMSGREEERKEVRVELDGSVQRLPLASRQKRAVMAALQHLVPLGTGGIHGGREDWDRDLRFCSPRHVERYFHLGAVIDTVPAYRLIQIARSSADRSRMEGMLIEAAHDGTLPEVLDRLPPLMQGLPESQVTIASVSLCVICDQIPADAPADLETRLVKFACELFAEIKHPLRRENALAALLDDGVRLTGPILLLHALRPRSDAPNGSGSTSLTLEQFRRLMGTALSRLKESAISGAIWRSRESGTLVKRWWDWSLEKDDVQSWLLHQVKEPANARAWLRTFLAPSDSAPGRELVLQLEELGQYCDPNAVAAGANAGTGDAIDRAAAKRLGQVLATKGSSSGVTVRTITIPLEAEAA